MSVATDLVPIVHIPPQARRPAPRSATVIALHQPDPDSIAPPVRLTRRGLVVLSMAVALVAVAILATAWRSAPGRVGGSAAGAAASSVPMVIVVREGDTLWSIATRVAPTRDPRAEVDVLERINHLGGDATLEVGQQLRTR